jgi:hypothetical protein
MHDMTSLPNMFHPHRMSQFMPKTKFPVEQPADYNFPLTMQTPAKSHDARIMRISQLKKIPNPKKRNSVSVILNYR